MPGQRASGQKLINIPIDEGDLRDLDDFVSRTNYEDRSKFIRAAIVEKMQRMGKVIPPRFLVPQYKPAHYGEGIDAGAVMNEPSSAATAAGSGNSIENVKKKVVSGAIRKLKSRKP